MNIEAELAALVERAVREAVKAWAGTRACKHARFRLAILEAATAACELMGQLGVDTVQILSATVSCGPSPNTSSGKVYLGGTERLCYYATAKWKIGDHNYETRYQETEFNNASPIGNVTSWIEVAAATSEARWQPVRSSADVDRALAMEQQYLGFKQSLDALKERAINGALISRDGLYGNKRDRYSLVVAGMVTYTCQLLELLGVDPSLILSAAVSCGYYSATDPNGNLTHGNIQIPYYYATAKWSMGGRNYDATYQDGEGRKASFSSRVEIAIDTPLARWEHVHFQADVERALGTEKKLLALSQFFGLSQTGISSEDIFLGPAPADSPPDGFIYGHPTNPVPLQLLKRWLHRYKLTVDQAEITVVKKLESKVYLAWSTGGRSCRGIYNRGSHQLRVSIQIAADQTNSAAPRFFYPAETEDQIYEATEEEARRLGRT